MRWQPAPPESAALALADGDIDVWWRPSLDHCDPAVSARGSSESLTREILSRYLSEPPDRLRLSRGAQGRPRLEHVDAPDFNLSDTVGGCLLAVARGGMVGVDVEHLDRSPAYARLAERWFCRAESDALQEMPALRARRAFLRLWTAKEAACKATGTGIYGHLAQWEFDPRCVRPRLLRPAGVPDASVAWRFWRLRPSPHHTAAVAWLGPVARLRGFVLSPCQQPVGLE